MSNKYALITGASGLLGKKVDKLLKSRGLTTIGLTHKSTVTTDIVIHSFNELSEIATYLDVIVNLAGAPIAQGRWTKARKRKLTESRVDLTYQLISTLTQNNISCGHFISGSAIGYYGTGLFDCSEKTQPGRDFSANLCLQWEAEAIKAEQFSQTTTLLRTGLVLAPNEGFLKPLYMTTKFGLGCIFGSGKQILSWIDIRDWTAAVAFILDQKLTGPVNLTSPNPVTQSIFLQTLASTLQQKIRFTVPQSLFLPLGEMKTLLLEGQRVIPNELLLNNFNFQYPQLSESLATLLTRE